MAIFQVEIGFCPDKYTCFHIHTIIFKTEGVPLSLPMCPSTDPNFCGSVVPCLSLGPRREQLRALARILLCFPLPTLILCSTGFKSAD